MLWALIWAENYLSWELCSELGFLLPDRTSVIDCTSHHTCLHRLDKREVVMATLVVGTKQSMCWRITSGKLLILSTAPLTFLSSLILVCDIILRAQILYIYIGLKETLHSFLYLSSYKYLGSNTIGLQISYCVSGQEASVICWCYTITNNLMCIFCWSRLLRLRFSCRRPS